MNRCCDLLKGFPRVIGAIDCTHIPISTPIKEIEANYLNRKSTHSLNVQVGVLHLTNKQPLSLYCNDKTWDSPAVFSLQITCDHQCMVTSLDARWPGSMHDNQIFEKSSLCQRFQEGMVKWEQ